MEGSDDGEVSNHVDLVELLVDHEAKDAHHGGAAVVELDGTLGELGLLIEGVPSKIKGAVAEVAGELSLSSDILHDAKLKSTDEKEELDEASLGDGSIAEDSGKAVGVRLEGVTGVVNVTREVDAVTGHDLAEESKLADTAVLELDVTKAIELLLVGICEEAKGIEESKRGLGTELALEGVDGGGGLADLGGREGGGRASKDGSDGELHDFD
uniref:Uncharacterized protein n=1 Tax=Odontella aurita TaxID=265563 RepID=A0A7S4N1G3_9STRA|mmetsp:Transcript_43632/g.132804  ORF Transcript_43632/g.132804 Transcript_43632/m.132804 type:complete len:212 (+) Transcript_43632:294-929(+)